MEGRTVSHYRVLSRLGGGGMGVVYKAEDTRLKRAVALKFLPPELTRDDEARQRFMQEAQAASALDHPNICTIHEVDSCAIEGSSETQLFIAMAFYDGETLKSRLARGRLSITEAIDIALQIARGLDNAHQARIVHRDIKPANVMLTNQGLAKIVDFGIAKLVDQTGPTRTGTTLGTVAYMAPEQLAGGAADHRVDIWAFGVVLYEMLAGERPFKGDSELAIIRNILDTTPADVTTLTPDAPPDLANVVRRALTKSVDARYASAADIVRDLSACQAVLTAPVTVVREVTRPAVSRGMLATAALIVIGLVAVPFAWWLQQRAQSREIDQAVAEVTALADADDYFAAFERLRHVEQLAADDERLAALREQASVPSSLVTEPPGATVSIRDYRHIDGEWTIVGQTPITETRLPRGVLRWRYELDGHDAQEFISPAPPMAPPGGRGIPPIRMSPQGAVPEGMVLIRRPVLGLPLAGFDYTRQFPGPDFLIDKFEVTNRQFREFVDAGGYTSPAFWKHPFVRGAEILTFEQAMAEFRDRTGRPGPATWEVGSYPRGKDNHPVGGVSWYEAAAYAEFAGKSLPTVYHWAAAATTPAAAFITHASNMNGKDSAPVGAFKAVTGTGLFDMAGNLREWCWNQVPDGSARYRLGASWADPTYMFTQADARDPFDRADTNGFRLVKYLDGAMPPAAMEPIRPPLRDGGRTPVAPEVVEAYAPLYRYDPLPLDARVESRDESHEFWVHEVVTYTSADGKERWPAHVLLPKNARPPYQAVVIAPNASVLQPIPLATMVASPGWSSFFSYVVQSGRAAIVPVYSGANERNTWQRSSWPEPGREAAFIEWMIDVTRDARRAVDYLHTRDDIDVARIAVVAQSWGAVFTPRALAFDDRFKTAVLLDGGAGSSTQLPGYASIDALNFANRARQPVLMVNGSEDFILPLESAQKPLFERLGAPAEHKRHVVLPGGHSIIGQQRNQVVREVLNWLDMYLGPVEQ